MSDAALAHALYASAPPGQNTCSCPGLLPYMLVLDFVRLEGGPRIASVPFWISPIA
jgi:hypothetical protein